MLKDRVALISGAATGIGEAVARLFASQGAHTYLLDRDSAGCRRVAESIVSAGGSATAFGGDVQRPTVRPIERVTLPNRELPARLVFAAPASPDA